MIEKVVIQGKEYTLDEARELYNDLHQLFGSNDNWYPYTPLQWYYPSYPGYDPYKITCGATITSTANE